ncbi:MAG: putative short chain dehydrogenase [Herminiimonas sp.]|nr:putative short chain dehydrogenase [Herminiimonas sp.]MDB5853412.1 putative short chain dehydrogenase [Herminiimonas sp.]
MSQSLARVALVTGGARRIGREISIALARRGWDVVVHYRRSREEALETVRQIEIIGRRATAIDCNLEDEAAVRQLLPRAAALLGPVSCLVNNASLFEHDEAKSLSQSRFDAHMHINLLAPLILSQALYDATPEAERSVAINILDQKLFNPNPDFLSYTLSKAAFHSATTLLAQALAPRVRVVGVAPGITLVSGEQSPQGFDKAHAVTPLGRSSTPQDIAAAVCFLAEAPAITGTTLVVDGGQHLIPLARDVMFLTS